MDPDIARADPEDYSWYPDQAMVDFVASIIPSEILFENEEMNAVCFGEQALRDQLDIRFEPGPNAVFTLSSFPPVSSICNGDLVLVPLAELGDLPALQAADYFPDIAR